MRITSISALFSILFMTAAMANPIISITAPSKEGSSVRLELSEADLRSYDAATFTTINPYVEVPTEFTGALLRDLLADFDLSDATSLRLRAINDYAVSMPVDDIEKYDVIVAYLSEGEPMSVRDKGPLWVMYPISDNPELDDPSVHSRLIWQLVAIEAE